MNLPTRERNRDASLFPGVPLEIVVLFTSVELADAALKKAEELAAGLEVKIRLVRAQIVPYSLPVEKPPISLDHLINELETISRSCSQEVVGQIVLARNLEAVLRTALKPHSIVVLASHRRLWRTKEEHLKNLCVKDGHEVVLCYAR